MSNEVTELLDAFTSGTMSVDEVASDSSSRVAPPKAHPARDVPRTRRG